jgi:hypothetical protein
MTVLIHSQRRIALTGTLAVLLICITSATTRAKDASPAEADDGWRHTKDGWEQMSTWDIPRAHLPHQPVLSPNQSAISGQWDTCSLLHPAVMALGLCALGCAGLALSANAVSRPPFASEG